MGTYQEDGFRFLRHPAIGDHLWLESERLDACVEKVLSSGLVGVCGATSRGFTETDLDVLADMPGLRSVWFFYIDRKVVDVNGLYQLAQLESFGLHPKRAPIDFMRLPLLKRIHIEPVKGDSSLEELAILESLSVARFKSKDNTFDAVGVPDNLKELHLSHVGVDSLRSLPAMPILESITVAYCRRLTEFGPLNTRFPSLRCLIVSNCPKLSNDVANNAASELRCQASHVFIQGKKLV